MIYFFGAIWNLAYILFQSKIPGIVTGGIVLIAIVLLILGAGKVRNSLMHEGGILKSSGWDMMHIGMMLGVAPATLGLLQISENLEA